MQPSNSARASSPLAKGNILLIVMGLGLAAVALLVWHEIKHRAEIHFVSAKAAEVNAQLPKQLDAYTTLLSMDVVGSNLIYRYRLDHLPRGTSTTQILSALQASVKSRACTDKDMSEILNHDFSVTLAYSDIEGSSVGSIQIPSKTCR